MPMRCDRTLLERLADPDPDTQRTIRENPRRLADSVMRHLQKMLNTRQGHVLIQPEYGMPDVTDCAEGAPEALDRIRRAIRNSIEMFEPRLQRVKIVHYPADDDLDLHFGISGQLATDKEQIPVRFSTTVGPSGSATINAGRDPEDLGAADARGAARRNDSSAGTFSRGLRRR
jgi:type VI secretion system protein